MFGITHKHISTVQGRLKNYGGEQPSHVISTVVYLPIALVSTYHSIDVAGVESDGKAVHVVNRLAEKQPAALEIMNLRLMILTFIYPLYYRREATICFTTHNQYHDDWAYKDEKFKVN